MPARDLFAPVGAEQKQRPLLRCLGERRQHLEGRRICPLQVVEDDDRRCASGDRLERSIARLRRASRGRSTSGGGPNSGNNTPRCATRGSPPNSSSGSRRRCSRSTIAIGAYGEDPRSAATPRRLARRLAATAASARRVFPTPASPARSTSPPLPLRRRMKCSRSSSSSRSRPIIGSVLLTPAESRRCRRACNRRHLFVLGRPCDPTSLARRDVDVRLRCLRRPGWPRPKRSCLAVGRERRPVSPSVVLTLGPRLVGADQGASDVARVTAQMSWPPAPPALLEVNTSSRPSARMFGWMSFAPASFTSVTATAGPKRAPF